MPVPSQPMGTSISLGCLVLKDADEVDVLAANRLDEHTDATPAVAGNQLFIRGDV